MRLEILHLYIIYPDNNTNCRTNISSTSSYISSKNKYGPFLTVGLNGSYLWHIWTQWVNFYYKYDDIP